MFVYYFSAYPQLIRLVRICVSLRENIVLLSSNELPLSPRTKSLIYFNNPLYHYLLYPKNLYLTFIFILSFLFPKKKKIFYTFIKHCLSYNKFESFLGLFYISGLNPESCIDQFSLIQPRLNCICVGLCSQSHRIWWDIELVLYRE